MKNWEYVHRFYDTIHDGDDWPDETEDAMCPSFLPLYDAKSNGKLTDKWLQLFISHNKGCQYYAGTLKDEKAGFKVRISEDGKEYADIYYDSEAKKLVADTSNSGISEWFRLKEEAPFELADDEKLELDIFVDKSVIEVFANERQAITRRIYPTNPEKSLGVKIIGNPGSIEKLDAWEMTPANPY